MGTQLIEVKQAVTAANDTAAEAFRTARRASGTFFTDIMASPGAGKTTLLLALVEQLVGRDVPLGRIGVIEADLASMVDAERIKAAGVTSVEVNTRGICHVEMGMVERAWAAFDGNSFDYLFLENIGNLVCPADFDTGAHCRVMLLSVPEGWDKVVKYPPMFAAVEALIVTKCDYLPTNPDFDLEALGRYAAALNPDIQLFVTSARTGEGMGELVDWLQARRASELA